MGIPAPPSQPLFEPPAAAQAADPGQDLPEQEEEADMGDAAGAAPRTRLPPLPRDADPATGPATRDAGVTARQTVRILGKRAYQGDLVPEAQRAKGQLGAPVPESGQVRGIGGLDICQEAEPGLLEPEILTFHLELMREHNGSAAVDERIGWEEALVTGISAGGDATSLLFGLGGENIQQKDASWSAAGGSSSSTAAPSRAWRSSSGTAPR